MTHTAPKRSPWGKVQDATELALGIWGVGTAGHGGIKLSRQRNQEVPDYMRREGGWYEEDIDWCIPATIFPDILGVPGYFAPSARDSVDDTMKNWLPDIWERYHSMKLKPGESYLKDEQLFFQHHANSWLSIVAFGDWKEWVPEGYVGVIASLGGVRRGDSHNERTFLVPQDEYQSCDKRYRFVIDELRHTEIRTVGMEAA